MVTANPARRCPAGLRLRNRLTPPVACQRCTRRSRPRLWRKRPIVHPQHHREHWEVKGPRSKPVLQAIRTAHCRQRPSPSLMQPPRPHPTPPFLPPWCQRQRPSPSLMQPPRPHPTPPFLPAWCQRQRQRPPRQPEPTPEPAPEEPFEDRDCGDFSEWQDAQDFFLAEGGPDEDPHGLDRDGDGVACQSLPGSPRNERELPTPSPSPSPTAAPEAQLTEEPPAHPDLLFDPSGPDRDCGDFPSWWEAQNFYLAAGGPGQDPHSLDHNGDGIACQSLDGAPANDPQAAKFRFCLL